MISEGLVEGLADPPSLVDRDDDKERLLMFSDSRQDAVQRARFITYAGCYDRMRQMAPKRKRADDTAAPPARSSWPPAI